MDTILQTDYQIVIIIITIIGFIISTAFYVYFVYLPASRIEDQFEIINKRGEDVINTINNRITDVENETTETLISACQSIQSFICAYNCAPDLGGCIPGPTSFCPLREEAYPQYCQDLLPPFTTCPGGLPSTCTPVGCPPVEQIPLTSTELNSTESNSTGFNLKFNSRGLNLKSNSRFKKF